MNDALILIDDLKRQYAAHQYESWQLDKAGSLRDALSALADAQAAFNARKRMKSRERKQAKFALRVAQNRLRLAAVHTVSMLEYEVVKHENEIR